jgi:2-hydroxychromene-2-carboxylate isomerase
MQALTFWFDPGCPWTWITSRWLVEAAARREVPVAWRSLSLAVLNGDREVPEAYRAARDASVGAHRVFAALLAEDRDDLVAGLYTELGRRWFHDGGARAVADVADAAARAGAGSWAAAAGDARWDEALAASTRQAVGLAGPDVGSPVLSWGDPPVAVFGPILSPAPTGEDAAVLLDRIVTLGSEPGFFELKRGRSHGPVFGARP